VADVSFTDATMLKWLPPNSKLLEVYGLNVSQITINPRIGYRHKLINIAITGLYQNSTSLSREALDIILGPKTLMRFPAWTWGSWTANIGDIWQATASTGLPWFLDFFVQKGVLDLLPDAAQDEPITLNVISGTSYSKMEALYVEYPSDKAAAHDMPGGSDYWKKYFFAWFYLLGTTVASGQQLAETGDPFGMTLLGENGRIPPDKVFHQIGIVSGYPNANQNSSITNYTTYNALHEWRNDEELFTPESHAGLYSNQEGSGYGTDTSLPLYQGISRLIDFNENDALNLYADVTAVSGSGGPIWAVVHGVLEDLTKKPATAGGTP